MYIILDSMYVLCIKPCPDYGKWQGQIPHTHIHTHTSTSLLAVPFVLATWHNLDTALDNSANSNLAL